MPFLGFHLDIGYLMSYTSSFSCPLDLDTTAFAGRWAGWLVIG